MGCISFIIEMWYSKVSYRTATILQKFLLIVAVFDIRAASHDRPMQKIMVMCQAWQITHFFHKYISKKNVLCKHTKLYISNINWNYSGISLKISFYLLQLFHIIRKHEEHYEKDKICIKTLRQLSLHDLYGRKLG